MSEQSEFEEWFSKYGRRNVVSKMDSKAIWQACADRKDKEFAALQRFAKVIINEDSNILSKGFILVIGQKYNLIDEHGNPTPLLTGETE